MPAILAVMPFPGGLSGLHEALLTGARYILLRCDKLPDTIYAICDYYKTLITPMYRSMSPNFTATQLDLSNVAQSQQRDTTLASSASHPSTRIFNMYICT